MKSLVPSFVLLTLALAAPAQGGVLYSGGQNLTIPADFNGIYLDLTDPNDATAYNVSFTDPGAGNWDVNFFYGGAAIGTSDTFLPVTDAAATNADIVNQTALVDTIDGTEPTPTSFSGSTGHMSGLGGTFTSGTMGWLGFQISDGSGGFHNGWMEVTLRDDGSPGIIHRWAWDNMGGAPLVGVIPEPSAAGVAGFLLLTCALFQRRRKVAVA